jgi:hypothetical protein
VRSENRPKTTINAVSIVAGDLLKAIPRAIARL